MKYIFASICLGGIEEIVSRDIYDKFNGRVEIENISGSDFNDNSELVNGKRIFKGESGCGKLIIKNVTDISIIRTIRSSQYWMLFLGYVNKMTPNLEESLKILESMIENVDFRVQIENLGNINGKKFIYENTSFCVRCIRDGFHKYNSLDISKYLGSYIINKSGWKVDLKNMDVEVLCFILNERVLIGFYIPFENGSFQRSRLPTEVRSPILKLNPNAPSLRPSTSYIMSKLLKICPGDILIDATCGSGSGMIESSLSFHSISLGGDCDIELAPVIKSNVDQLNRMTKRKSISEGLFWSAHKLPIRNGTIDCILIDLPFIQQSKRVPKFYRARMNKFVNEIARVLNSQGRFVILCQSSQQILSCLDSLFFEKIQYCGVNIGGYICSLIWGQRTSILYEDVNMRPIIKRKLSDIISG